MAKDPKKLITGLTAARDLISKPGAWTQDVTARGADGKPCMEKDKAAVCFCVLGALNRASSETPGSADWMSMREDLLDFTKGYSIAEWNDTTGRTQQEVIDLFNKAIERQETAA